MKTKQNNIQKLKDLSQAIEMKEREVENIRDKLAIESSKLSSLGEQIKGTEVNIENLKTQIYNKNFDMDKENKSKQQTKGDDEIGDPSKRLENTEQFENLENYLTGEILSDVKNNSDLLLNNPETKQVVNSVLVRFMQGDPSIAAQRQSKELQAYCQTFRIYGNTKFSDLKKAACKYWGGLILDQYELSDTKLNNLSTFQGTICDFYKSHSMQIEDNAVVLLFKTRKN